MIDGVFHFGQALKGSRDLMRPLRTKKKPETPYRASGLRVIPNIRLS